jgi:hypothetical protein
MSDAPIEIKEAVASGDDARTLYFNGPDGEDDIASRRARAGHDSPN